MGSGVSCLTRAAIANQLLYELLTGQTPATPKGSQGCLVLSLQPARLHLAFEFLAASGRILTNTVLA
jgi:hypothetical protein